MTKQAKSKTVIAEAGDFLAESSHRCCAERNVLDQWVQAARRHGIACHATVSWIKRKTGGTIVVQRFLFDDSPGCCVPCVFCRDEIKKYDLAVVCTITTGDSECFAGKLDGEDAPPSKFTGLQMKMLGGCRRV